MLFSKLNFLPLGAIKAEGFLKEQLLRNKHGLGGHLDEIEPGMIADPYIRKSYVKSWEGGQQEGWGAEISGNYYTGLIQLAWILDDEVLKQKATEWVDRVLATQLDNGYLGTYNQPNSMIYEDYNAGANAYGYYGLLCYYEATGREDVFDAIYQTVLWFAEHWAGEQKTNYVGQNIVEIAAYCYRKTRDPRLLEFCRDYVEFLPRHNRFNNSYRDYLIPKLRYLDNHTGAHGLSIKIPALVYSISGNPIYLEASEFGLEKLHRKAVQVTGSAVSSTEYLGPVSAVGETEYCVFAYFNRSYSHMLAITGKAKYADWAENLVYNGAQGARKKDERAVAYLSSPNQIFATDISSNTMWDRQVYASCYPTPCCHVNSVVVMPEFIRSMAYSDDDGNLYLSSYGPCRISHDEWEIREETLYPFRTGITLRISGSKGRKLFCRVPGWAVDYKVFADGSAVKPEKTPEGYIEVPCSEEVTLQFDAAVEVISVDDSDGSGKHPLAFRYGPLAFSLPIETEWQPYYPETETPLEPQWPWFRAVPKKPEMTDGEWYENIGREREFYYWNVAVDETLQPKDVRVEYCQPEGYPWETPYIKLVIPAFRAPLLGVQYMAKTFEPHGSRVPVTEPVQLELVPFGATNLRITYFFRADLE